MNVVLTLSGGLDSTILLYHLLSRRFKVNCLSVNYGQRHGIELLAAKRITNVADVPHAVIDLSPMSYLLPGSSQTDPSVEVPQGHYAEESMKKTVVPNRNMVLLSIAGAWAISLKYDVVAYAAHAGDHAIYPDCREEFIEPFSQALWNADWHHVAVLRPFMTLTKADIVALGVSLKVPFEMTYSCYKGGEKHCGKCGTCTERLLACDQVGFVDPVEYEDREFYKTLRSK